MRAWQLPAFGVDKLVLNTVPTPQPGEGELLVQPLAMTLNFRDSLVCRGLYNPRQPLPLIPGSDCCARVVAVGPNTDIAVGTRVIPCFSSTWLDGPLTDAGRAGALGCPVDGVMQERFIVRQDAVVVAPEHLSDAEAASLVCAGVTAWRALVTEGSVGPASRVLTLGTGGVSVFALQLAVALGAQVAITSSSDDKLATMRQLGASLTVNYRTHEHWGRLVADWGAADVVVELGGAGTLAQSLRAVRTGGTIALIGVLDGVVSELPLTAILMRAIRVQGIFVGSRSDLLALCDFLRAHPELRPHIHRTYAFEQLPQALDELLDGAHMGKLAIAGRA